MRRTRPIVATVTALSVLGGCLLVDPFPNLGETPKSDATGDSAEGEGSTPKNDASCIGADLASDPANCGSCGHACPPPFQCSGRRCGNEVVFVAAGALHTCAVLRRGDVWCWGSGLAGQTGHGEAGDAIVPPTLVARDDHGATVLASELTVGLEHTCALRDGQLTCWGSEIWGTLSNDVVSADGGALAQPIPSAAYQQPSLLSSEQYVYATVGRGPLAEHGCAVEADGGRVVCWGRGDRDQLGPIAPAVGNTKTSCAGGTDNCRSLPSRVGTFTAAQIALGAASTCIRDDTGKVTCWGANLAGQLGSGFTLCFPFNCDAGLPPYQTLVGPAAFIASGESSSCAVLQDKTVWCWGANGDDQLGEPHLDSGTRCCIKDNGCITYCNPTPTRVAGIDGAVSVAVGARHACALREDGTVWCWGANDRGQLGTGDAISSAAPRRVTNLADVAGLTAGAAHTCAWTKAGAVRCWGLDDHGQLGAPGGNSPVPIAPAGLP